MLIARAKQGEQAVHAQRTQIPGWFLKEKFGGRAAECVTFF